MRSLSSFAKLLLVTTLLFSVVSQGALAGSLVISGPEFHQLNWYQQNGYIDSFRGYYYAYPNEGEASAIAPVALPNAATVTGFTVYYYDDDASTGIECTLRRNTYMGDGGYDNAIASTFSTDDDQLDHSMVGSFITNASIDNTTYYYFIFADFPPATDGYRRLYACVIDYDDPIPTATAPATSFFGHASAQPNPFASSTSIRFSLRQAGPVSIDIYDIKGRKVRTIDKSGLQAGMQTLSWDGYDDDGRQVASGVYFAQVKGQGEALAAKLVRVR